MRGGSLTDGRTNLLKIIRNNRPARCNAAPLLHLCAEHQRVVLDDLPGLHIGAGRYQLCACGNDGNARLAAHHYSAVTASSQRTQVHRTQPLVGRQHQLCGHHVFARGAHMLPRRQRRADLYALRLARVCAAAHGLCRLNWNHSRSVLRQRIAGVNVNCLVRYAQLQRRALRSACRVPGAHRIPIHCCRVIMRRRKLCPHRHGRYPPQRIC